MVLTFLLPLEQTGCPSRDPRKPMIGQGDMA
jgi:hypothetical protein